MNIIWLTQGGLLFQSGSKKLLDDLYMSDCLKAKGFKRMLESPLPLSELKPDAFLFTHDYLDHLVEPSRCAVKIEIL